jgi:hypothetical protein
MREICQYGSVREGGQVADCDPANPLLDSKDMFYERFRDYGRTDQFSGAGLDSLYDYLTELEDDTGEEMELDVISICCGFAEYSVEELMDEYGYLMDGEECIRNDKGQLMDADGVLEILLDKLNDRTTVIEFDKGYIIQAF